MQSNEQRLALEVARLLLFQRRTQVGELYTTSFNALVRAETVFLVWRQRVPNGWGANNPNPCPYDASEKRCDTGGFSKTGSNGGNEQAGHL